MTFTETHKSWAAAAGIAILAVGGYKYFMPRAEADEQKKELEQKQAKSVAELRIEVYMDRIQILNEKEAKESLSASEKQERDLKLKLVEELRKEQAKK